MPEKPRIVIMMAAGSGSRMGGTLPKQFLTLGGRALLRRSIERFTAAIPGIKVITVLPEEYLGLWRDYCSRDSFHYPQTLVAGGMTRFHSVRNALRKVTEDGALVAVHDGVRPFVSERLIDSMFRLAESCRALIPVVPSTDTIKVLDRIKGEDGSQTLASTGERADRSRIFAAQTPQIFRSEDLRSAYAQAFDTAFTDDASVVQAKGIPLSFCPGERLNIKITTPEDLVLGEAILKTLSSR